MITLELTMKPYDDGQTKVSSETMVVSFSDDQLELAFDIYVEWLDWIDRGIDSVLAFSNPRTGLGWNARPSMVESLHMIYKPGVNNGSFA